MCSYSIVHIPHPHCVSVRVSNHTECSHFSEGSCAVCVSKHTESDFTSQKEAVESMSKHTLISLARRNLWGLYVKPISLLGRKLWWLCVKAHNGWFHFWGKSHGSCVSKHTDSGFTSYWRGSTGVCQNREWFQLLYRIPQFCPISTFQWRNHLTHLQVNL